MGTDTDFIRSNMVV